MKRSIVAAGLLAISSIAAAQADGDAGTLDSYASSQMASMRAMNICSGLWQGNLSLETIERELNGRDASFGTLRDQSGTEIDHDARIVAAHYADDMPPRYVVWRPVVGCIQLPPGASREVAEFLPRLPEGMVPPDLDDRPWPTGDASALQPLEGAAGNSLEQLVEAAFDGETYGGRTWGVVIVKDGLIIAERYADGFDLHSASQTHSAAKSFASSLVGIAQGQDIISVEDAGLLAQWRRPGDPRASITMANLLHMASGLNNGGTRPPRFMDPYTQGLPVTDAVSGNFLATPPGSTFSYSPADTMLVMRSLREAMNDDAAYLRFPYQQLFWRLGMTRTSMNIDWDGNIFGSGQAWSSGRDFARFGLLYLNDGMWEGERILPAGWAQYVATPAPAQPSQGAGYGAQFWLYGPEQGLPAGSFTPSGGQGQYAMIVPGQELVVVRRGFDLESSFDIARFTADIIASLDN